VFLTQPLAADAAIAWSPAVDVARYSWHVRPHEGDLSEQRDICGDICWDPGTLMVNEPFANWNMAHLVR